MADNYNEAAFRMLVGPRAWWRLPSCWLGWCRHRPYADEGGCGGQCVHCGRIHGYITRDLLRAHDRLRVTPVIHRAVDNGDVNANYRVIESNARGNRYMVVDDRGDAELGTWFICSTWQRTNAERIAEQLARQDRRTAAMDALVAEAQERGEYE